MTLNRSVLILLALSLLSYDARAELTSEKLGYDRDAKILIIHADDVGMSHTVNRATSDLLKFGLVKSASMMTPCPWAAEVKSMLASMPNVDLGIHVTLTSEWKNYKWSPLSRAPGLSDSMGYFWPTLSEAIKHASPEEVFNELETQIKLASTLGITPTHIDSHMGVYFARPDYLRGVVALAKKYAIPPMLVRWSPEFEGEIARYKLDPLPIRIITEQAAANGAVLLDYLVTGVPGKTVQERKLSYDKFLKSLKPGVTQLIIHPGYLDDEMNGIMKDAPEGFYRREADRSYFSSPNTKKLIEGLGIKLIGWRELSKISWQKK